ncbi:peptidoglycan editing factor PgeF [Castellaniella sp. GW247-6E4]|uniref:peptidoglycan editing factor PgeF n=1 Tax=Castellaniella sp. GW247-6E4 TaxID=3140380 RepID=UPI003315BBA5
MTTAYADSAIERVTGQPWPGVHYFCSTRAGGGSAPPWDGLNLGLHVGDAPRDVLRNRALLGSLLPAEPLWLDQVHGTEVCDADAWGGDAPPRADAAVTTRPDRPLIIMTADCLPVVLADAGGGVLGVAHAGWRGLAAGVLENTLERMRPRAPRDSRWHAWIGPAIGQASFEVGPEVREAFTGPDPSTAAFFNARPGSDRWLADLPAIASHRLRAAGVEQIESSHLCTYRDAQRFYSYRRAARTGRQATVAWLAPRPAHGAAETTHEH